MDWAWSPIRLVYCGNWSKSEQILTISDWMQSHKNKHRRLDYADMPSYWPKMKSFWGRKLNKGPIMQLQLELTSHSAKITWNSLQAQAFSMIQSQGPTQDGSPVLRKSAFRVFSGCPNLVMDIQTDAVLNVLGRGLQDQYSIEVRHYRPFKFLSFVLFLRRLDTRLWWLQ